MPADVVVPVPDSGVTAALGYAEESGIPFRFGLIRNHYVGRTFIEPEQRVRDFGVRLKLNPVRNLLEGKRVILIDDSIIRGTTSRKIVRMVRGGGEGSSLAHQLPAHDFAVLLWSGHAEQARADCGQSIGRRDSAVYRGRFAGVSFAGWLAAGLRRRRGQRYCTACYTGIYPTQWVDVEDIFLPWRLAERATRPTLIRVHARRG